MKKRLKLRTFGSFLAVGVIHIALGVLFSVMFIFDNSDVYTTTRAFWAAIFGA